MKVVSEFEIMKNLLTSFALLLFILQSTNAQSNGTKLVDEFSTTVCGNMKVRLDVYASDIHKDSDSRGLVIVYKGRFVYEFWRKGKAQQKTSLPIFGQTTDVSHWMIRYLENRGLDSKKVMFIDGGIQENFKVALWIIPRGGDLPKPAPTRDKIRYRKGAIPRIC